MTPLLYGFHYSGHMYFFLKMFLSLSPEADQKGDSYRLDYTVDFKVSL